MHGQTAVPVASHSHDRTAGQHWVHSTGTRVVHDVMVCVMAWLWCVDRRVHNQRVVGRCGEEEGLRLRLGLVRDRVRVRVLVRIRVS